MKSYAAIKEGLVVQLLVADSLEDAEFYSKETCVEYDPLNTLNAPNIGLSYTNGVFEQHPLSEEVLAANESSPITIEAPTDGKTYVWDVTTNTWVVSE